MTSIVSFILTDLEDDREDPPSRDFEVVGMDPQEFFNRTAQEDSDFQGYIEDVEFGRGPRHGTIDMGSDMSPDRTKATWYFGSCEIEDKDGFIADTVKVIEQHYGWTLKEI